MDGQWAQERQRLVAGLRTKGIRDERVLQALADVPRHLFVAPEQGPEAYVDEPLPIGMGQTISQPFTVAYQTQLLEVTPPCRVLEVGTGSGYQAAVLATLGVELFSVERHAELSRRAGRVLEHLHLPVHLRVGDGTRGWAEAAPFDAILVTAAGASAPPALLEQLRIPGNGRRGGRLVMPVGPPERQIMTRWTCRQEGRYDEESFEVFRFVPLVSDDEP